MSKKYWLHRISHNWEVSYVLFEKGYLSLGWSVFAKTNILEAARNSTDEFEKVYSSKREKHRSRWNMWYLAQFKTDDVVVVPLDNGNFSVCKVIEPAKPINTIQNEIGNFVDKTGKSIIWEDGLLKRVDDDCDVDLGFVVKVKKIKSELKRSEYADKALTKRMKMRQTNGDISDIADSVDDALNATSPICFYNTALKKGSESLKEIIDTKLNPDKFEHLVEAYMLKLGADNTEVPAKNESGKKDGADADVIADFENLRVTVLIQVKHHENKTGKWAVEQISQYKKQLEDVNSDLSHIKDEKYTNITWVVSSCDDFEEEAIALANLENVRLIRGSDFAEMLIKAGLPETDI